MKGNMQNDINVEGSREMRRWGEGERLEKQWENEKVREGERLEKCKYKIKKY